MTIDHPDHATYRIFSKKQRQEKAVRTLQGLLEGISIDNELNADEIAELINWMRDHGDLAGHSPFDEVNELLKDIIEDQVIEPDEQEDLLWLCKNLSGDSEVGESIRADIQTLHGVLHGILADGEVSEEEVRNLQEWILEREHLKGVFPYDEIDSLLISVLKDGKVDEEEKASLKAFFEEFVDFSRTKKFQKEGSEIAKASSIRFVCAADPSIEFGGKTFVFSGSSFRGTRKQLLDRVKTLQAIAGNNVTNGTDYLVIGGAGNPCWVFSCYGRKIEKAVQMRREGHRILIIHERDFWDAVEDHGE